MKKLKFCIAMAFTVYLLSAGNMVFAAPICPIPYEVTQPNGAVITVTSYGDEFFSWTEDEYGNVVVYDEETDSYRYAKIEDGKLTPTPELVGGASLFRSAVNKLQREDILPLWENAERIDYSQTTVDDGIALMSASEEPAQKKTLTHQKLLTLLIEFSDVKIKYDDEFWHKRMFSTDPKDISVVNYWKENANGLDVFEPADTSNIPDGVTGKGSSGEFEDIGYTITACPEGVVKVSLNTPHPSKTWENTSQQKAYDIIRIALSAIEPYFDYDGQEPYPIAIFAGYESPYGNGIGQVQSNATNGGAITSGGSIINKYVLQGELGYNDSPAGIGVTCHELGHSVFKLPDLYFDFMPNGGWTNNGLFYYSLMSTGCWGHLYIYDGHPSAYNIWDDPYAGKRNQVPTHLDPWCKIQCGFVTPTIVNEWDGDINSISEMGIGSQYNVLELRSKTVPNQYFLVENRQLIGYDAGLEIWKDTRLEPYDGGVIIYHVDEGVWPGSFNNNSILHPFIKVEQSVFSDEIHLWEFLNIDGRNKLNGETTPNSNLHQLKKLGDNCKQLEDCHPQTLESGISIEVIGGSAPSVRVVANVEDDYRITILEGAKFSDIFPDANFCRAVIDNMEERDGLTRSSSDVLTIGDWATLASMTDLYLDSYGIKDLTGIEYFTMLNTLSCYDNEISNLDPLTPKQAQIISELDCGNNKLTKLDLSQWKNLSWLYCENNMLSSLILPESEELTRVDCQNNKLTSLDLSKSPALSILYCHENLMDAETPENSIQGFESLWEPLGTPLSKDHIDDYWYIYYPQNTAEAEHNWSSEWQKDDTHHWHNCSDADCPITNNAEKNGYGEHIWDSGNVTTQPTCTTAGIKTYTCTVCQATKTEEITARHHYGPAWKTDQTNHWHECACGDKADRANHVYDNATDTTCNICGYKRTVAPPTPPSPIGPSISYHTITATVSDGGQIEPSGKVSVQKNANQTFTVIPAEGYEVVDVLVDGKSVGAVKEYTFEKVTKDHTIEASFSKVDERPGWNPFEDVNSGDWFHDSVKYIYEQKLMVGTGQSHFSPRLDTSRAMIATILWRLEGSPAPTQECTYTDCHPNAYYARAVAWGTEQGILNGYGGNLFGPDDPITREQLAAMLYRYAGNPAPDGTLESFSDAEASSQYALDALCWAVKNGIMNGKGGGILDPKGCAIRAATAAMLHRYLTLKG